MSPQPTWLYMFVYFAGASLVVAVYVAGLVIALRRWHLGMAARLGAIGFGLLVFEHVIRLVHYVLGPLLNRGEDMSALFLQMAVAQSFFALLSTIGILLVVLAFRAALRDYERSRNALPTDAGLEARP